jgi:Ca-activated chloride channel homolog
MEGHHDGFKTCRPGDVARCGLVPGGIEHSHGRQRGDRTAFCTPDRTYRSPELRFDPSTAKVTLKVPLVDQSGSVLPHVRRDQFSVVENGVPVSDVRVDIEHAHVTVAALIEMGGRSQQLNRTLSDQAPYFMRPLISTLDRDDTFALFTYDDVLHTVIDFDDSHDKWESALRNLPSPRFSEANLYDAAIEVLERLASRPGPKALFLITTGIDTFSHASFNDLARKAELAKIPIFALGFEDVARSGLVDTARGPLGRVNWSALTRELQTLAAVSGGRVYVRPSSSDLAAIYDEVMEQLRVRYVITYVSPQPATQAAPRTVEVQIVQASRGELLSRRTSTAPGVGMRTVARATYTPGTALTRSS